MLKRFANVLLTIFLLPFATVLWFSKALKETKEEYMEVSLFECDTCHMPALKPEHMSFEWASHGECDCRDGFRMIHNEEFSPFGDCHMLIQENHRKPLSVKKAPVDVLGTPTDPRRSELFSYVRHNRPDLVRKGILRWAELGGIASRAKNDE